MSLEHELCLTRGDVPELDGSVLGSGYDPLTIRRDGDRQHVVLIGSVTALITKKEASPDDKREGVQ